jgi:cobalt-zinc-cadmium efflux system outer membrane protein
MRTLKWIALAAVGSAIVGCRGAQPSDKFDEVSADISSRTGATLHWNRDSEAAAVIDQRVHELLAAPLNGEAAVQIALLNNRSLQATIEELGIARADLIEAGLLQNPVLGVSARFPDVSGSTNLEFTITQSFLELLVVGARKKLSEAQFDRARLIVTKAVLDLAWDTETAFHAAAASEQLLTLQQTIAEAQGLKRDLAAKQYEAGNISELDQARQQAAADESKLNVTMAQAEWQSQRERLNRLMGFTSASSQWTVASATDLLLDDEPDIAELEHMAAAHRVELAIARQEMAIVDRALDLARKGFVSELDLGVSTEREPEGFWVTGPVLQIELPIFDHRGIRVERLEAQQRQAQHMLAALETNVLSEVRQAHANLVAARAMAEYLRDEVIPLRQRIVKLSQEHYNAMLMGVYELLAAREEEIDAQSSLIQAMRDFWIARTTLKQAVGGTLPHGAAATPPAQPDTPMTAPTPTTKPEADPGAEHEHHDHGGE